MGIKEILTKPLRFGSAEMTWQEPFGYRIRLRGDAHLRLAIAVAAWLGASGLLLILFSFSQNPGDVKTALGLGLIAGGYALGSLLGLRSQVSGRVDVHGDMLRRSSTSFGYVYINMNDEQWEYAEIQRCAIVPGESIDKPFSVLIVSGGGDRMLIGLPRQVSLKEVAGLLKQRGVEVVRKDRVPDSLTKGITLAGPSIAAIAGLVLLAAGLVLHGGDRDGGQPIALERPELPGPEMPAIDRPQRNQNVANSRQPPEVPDANTPDIPIPTPSGFPGFGDQPSPITAPGSTSERQPAVAAGSRPPDPDRTPSDVDRTGLIGGDGGFEFERVDPDQRPMIGLRYSMGFWAGQMHLGQLTPLFDRPEETADVVVAKPGYAVGALHITAGEYVDRIVLEFHRLKPDGTLDSSDSYTSSPIGTASADAKLLRSDGNPVIGIYGRGAAVLDALGLVLKP